MNRAPIIDKREGNFLNTQLPLRFLPFPTCRFAMITGAVGSFPFKPCECVQTWVDPRVNPQPKLLVRSMSRTNFIINLLALSSY